jgi:hypothetical protein
MAKNWIAGMHMKEGAFGAQAKRQGLTTAQLTAKTLKSGSKATAKSKKRAVVAKTLKSFGK